MVSDRGDRIESNRAPEPMGLYPAARRVGNLLFVSGIGPRKRGESRIPGVQYAADGTKIGRDIEVQLRSVCDNLRIVLEDAGSSWDRIVDVTAFLAPWVFSRFGDADGFMTEEMFARFGLPAEA